MALEQWLTGLWYGARARGAPLAPLGWLYGAVLRGRRRAYAAGWLRSGPAGAPVVVIGNFTVGGTGKTPFTIWLAGRLSAQGLKVGIVSRGYGGHGGAPRAVLPESDWRELGDEPLLLARRSACAVVVARDRLAGARALVAAGAEVVLADDGLQHLRLQRNCEIVMIDGARGFGNGRVLPAGPLREPLTPLPLPDALVVTGAPRHGSGTVPPPLPRALAPVRVFDMRLTPEAAVRLDGREAPRALQAFRGQRVHAVAGLGNPARFFGELRAHGIAVTEHAFADHHRFVAAELDFADELPVLMTEKDAVKCSAFANPRLWYVPVAAQFEEREARELLARVLGKVRAAPEAQADG
jgi:tetraacyldisaccharide 4'-kinase